MTTPETTSDREPSVTFSVAIISPTKNEAANVEEFVKRTTAAMNDREIAWEIVFADDSDDDTPQVVAALAAAGARARCVHREPHERTESIAGAVKAAMATTDADFVVVIDADLQHPPEILPHLVGPLNADAADFVIGTRYAGGGSAEGLTSQWRRAASRGTALCTRLMFPAFWRCSDMASGLFAFRRRDFDTRRRPSAGFKFLPEAMVACDPDRVAEVPYTFEDRFDGLSKATVRDGVHLLVALMKLRVSSSRFRAVQMVSSVAAMIVPLNAATTDDLPLALDAETI